MCLIWAESCTSICAMTSFVFYSHILSKLSHRGMQLRIFHFQRWQTSEHVYTTSMSRPFLAKDTIWLSWAPSPVDRSSLVVHWPEVQRFGEIFFFFFTSLEQQEDSASNMIGCYINNKKQQMFSEWIITDHGDDEPNMLIWSQMGEIIHYKICHLTSY